MLAKYHSPPQVFVYAFAISSIVESSLVTSRLNHDSRVMPSNHVQQNPGLYTTLKAAVTFACDIFVGISLTGSNAIFLGRKNDRDYRVCSLAFYKTAGYCLDDCFASCENIVWISFKRMYGKLSPPLAYMNIANANANTSSEA